MSSKKETSHILEEERRLQRRKQKKIIKENKIQSHKKAYIAILLLFLAIMSIILFSYLYSKGVITSKQYGAYASIAVSLTFPLIVFSYLLRKHGSVKAVFRVLGLGRDKLTYRNIWIGVGLFIAILSIEMLLAVFQIITGIKLPTNVQKIYAGMPIWFFVLVFTLIPFDEETMFRGFLVPRVGIIVSALIFAALHASYLSIAEVIAAFVYGLLAGYTFKKTGSLYTTIMAHALINLVAVIAII